MSKLQSPYNVHPRPTLKRISCNVSTKDSHEFFARVPDWGFQDALLATLFAKAADAVRSANIPLPTSTDDYDSIQDTLTAFIRGCSFQPAPRPGPDGAK